jgi:hypothetical protein
VLSAQQLVQLLSEAVAQQQPLEAGLAAGQQAGPEVQLAELATEAAAAAKPEQLRAVFCAELE